MALLTEAGDYLLQEDGSKILLNNSVSKSICAKSRIRFLIENNFNDGTVQDFGDDGYNVNNRLRVDDWNKSLSGWSGRVNYQFKGKINVVSVSGVDDWRSARIVLRYSDDDNYYFFSICPNNGHIVLFRRNGGVETWLGEYTTAGISLNTDYSFETLISETDSKTLIRFIWDGTEILTVTDTGNTSLNSGKVGIKNNGATCDIDDVTIYSWQIYSSFVETFSENNIPFLWKKYGNSTWSFDGNTATEQTVGSVDPNKLIYLGKAFPQEGRTVLAKVKFNSIGEDDDRVGITVMGKASDGKGINLLLYSSDSLKFLDDGVEWGPSVSFKPSAGETYWFKSKYSNGYFYGKAWKVGTPEPGWMLTWQKTPSSDYLYSGLTGNSFSMVSKCSYDDFSIKFGKNITSKARIEKNVILSSSSNFGINYYHESMGYIDRSDNEIRTDLDNISTFTNKIKVYHNPYNSDKLDICKNIVSIAKSKGFYVIWAENYDGETPLNSNPSGDYSWSDYCSKVESDAAQAENVGADEFLVGNEISVHNDGGSPYNDTNLPANIKQLVTDCGEFFSGIISYQDGWWKGGSWNLAGLGSLEKIYFTLYENFGVFANEADTLLSYFGNKVEIGEISSAKTKSDLNNSEDDWARELVRKYDYLRRIGVKGYVFCWRETIDDGYGVWKFSSYEPHKVWKFLKRLSVLSYKEYFYNDFSSGTQSFGNDGYSKNGRLRVDDFNKSIASGFSFSDFVFRGLVNIVSVSGADDWRSSRLVFRYKDDDNYYFLAICPNNEKIQLWRRESGSENFISEITTSGIDIDKDYYFEIRVSGSGSSTSIDVFWDSKKIISATDTGNVGINDGNVGVKNNGATSDIDNVFLHNIEVEKSLGNYLQSKARIKSLGLSFNISARSRIRKISAKTISSKSRVNRVKVKNVLAKSRILRSIFVSLSSLARIKNTKYAHIEAKTRVKRYGVLKNISAKSDVKKLGIIRLISSKSRIKKLSIKNISAKLRVKIAGLFKKVSAKARIKLVKSKSVSSKARIKTYGKISSVSAKSDIRKLDILKLVSSKARIKVANIPKSISSLARIKIANLFKSISSGARITLVKQKYVSAKSFIKTSGVIKNVSAKSDIRKLGIVKLVSSKSRIKKVNIPRSISAKSRIKIIGISKNLSSKSRIVLVKVGSILAKSRIKVLSKTTNLSAKSDVKKLGVVSIVSSSARIKIADIYKYVKAKLRVKIANIPKKVSSKSRVKLINGVSILAKSRIKSVGILKSFSAKARIKIKDIKKDVSSKARIKLSSLHSNVSAKSRIILVKNKSISSKARISVSGITKTISALSDIRKLGVLKNIFSKSRVKISGIYRSVSSLARIKIVNVQRYVSSKSRIVLVHLGVIGAKSRIKVCNESNLLSCARILKTNFRSISSKSRIVSSGIAKNISSKADIRIINVVKKVSAVARINKATPKIIAAKARVKLLSILRNVASKARINLISSKTIQSLSRVKTSGKTSSIAVKARIKIINLLKTISAGARVNKQIAKNISARSRIKLPKHVFISSKARIKSFGNAVNVSAGADIRKEGLLKKISSKARVKLVKSFQVVAKARVKFIDILKSVSGKARVILVHLSNISGRARVKSSGKTTNISAVADIRKINVIKSISAKANILNTKVKNVLTKARVKIADIEKLISAKARLRLPVAKNILSKARVKISGIVKRIASKARIKISNVRIISSKSRIRTFGKINNVSAKSDIKKIDNEYVISSRSRIKVCACKSISAGANIVVFSPRRRRMIPSVVLGYGKLRRRVGHLVSSYDKDNRLRPGMGS